jgi:hypothetical protein
LRSLTPSAIDVGDFPRRIDKGTIPAQAGIVANYRVA